MRRIHLGKLRQRIAAGHLPLGTAEQVIAAAVSLDGDYADLQLDDWLRIFAGVDRPHPIIRRQDAQPPGKLRQARNVVRRAGRAARSVAKTSLGIDRATDEQVEDRLNVCRRCPGDHVVYKDGDVHTCGPMLESMRREGQGTCGCILRKKACDLRENCPFGWW